MPPVALLHKTCAANLLPPALPGTISGTTIALACMGKRMTFIADTHITLRVQVLAEELHATCKERHLTDMLASTPT